HGDDEANTQKLLDEMQGVADGDRSARFWCAIVFVEHANDPTP
ncbi:MAG TPA: non-canonical purine NTP pyrophosphatase, partial [Gammaproteobacteria bacterium]|nr:non-canonical purine NTP pyrophosphatase [Gammaproteobacteria bacterium]